MQERIFVRIASYRDPECDKTIVDAFEKAARPERLRVGVCVQYAPGRDSPNLELGRWAPQVEVLRVREAKSQGVCWARARAESLWRGEEFSLQVDSHSRFAPGFDDTLLAQLSEQLDDGDGIRCSLPPAFRRRCVRPSSSGGVRCPVRCAPSWRRVSSSLLLRCGCTRTSSTSAHAPSAGARLHDGHT